MTEALSAKGASGVQKQAAKGQSLNAQSLRDFLSSSPDLSKLLRPILETPANKSLESVRNIFWNLLSQVFSKKLS